MATIDMVSIIILSISNSLFILNYRNLDHHIQSINHWTDLRKRIYQRYSGLQKIGMEDADIKEWMLRHYCNVETFSVNMHPICS